VLAFTQLIGNTACNSCTSARVLPFRFPILFRVCSPAAAGESSAEGEMVLVRQWMKEQRTTQGPGFVPTGARGNQGIAKSNQMLTFPLLADNGYLTINLTR